MPQHVYNDDFYDYISRGSRESAEIVVPLLRMNVSAESVLDVGAGNGAWLSVWMESGITDICGVDGAYVNTSCLKIPEAAFNSHDLSTQLCLGRHFDLVQSLEVAEHLPELKADTFVSSLVAHGDIVLFSAAVRHQGGEHHLNEQPPEYWRRKFKVHGFACFDWLRPLLADQNQVKPWYRYNTLLYANEKGRKRLSQDILKCQIDDGVPVAIHGDMAWYARRAAVALIPPRGRHMIAMLKAAVEARAYRRHS